MKNPGQITITIETGNDAFSEDWRREASRVLIELGTRIRNGCSLPERMPDLNGNTVARIEYGNNDD